MPDPNLELINFLLRLATDRTLMRNYLKDPRGIARASKLSNEQVEALASCDQLTLNRLAGTDLSEWVIAAFQGVPPPLIPPPSKGKGKK